MITLGNDFDNANDFKAQWFILQHDISACFVSRIDKIPRNLCILCFITFLAIYQGKFGFGKFQQKLGLRSDPPAPCWAKCPTFSEKPFWWPPLQAFIKWWQMMWSLPLQTLFLQSAISKASPLQCLPPFKGGVHSRLLLLQPPPQVLLHSPHWLQLDQEPSTKSPDI